jgi:type I restriction enzyme, S subunit
LVAITSKQSQTNQQINSIVPTKNFYTYYLYFVLSSMKTLLKDLGSGGSATLNVNTSTFSNISCIMPEDKLLKSYLSIVKPLFEKILSNIYENQTLTLLRDSLLPKLMTGEVKIN